MKKLLLLPLLALLWFGASNLNRDLRELPLNRKERMTGIASSPEAKRFMLGYSSVAADWIWIKTMLYFGGNYASGDMPWLKQMVQSVIMLNPGFFPPYEFAGVVMPDLTGDQDFSRKVLIHGLGRARDSEERLAFYLAYIYYKERNDKRAAADQLTYAATADYAPPFWGKFAATLYRDAGDTDRGLEFLYAMYESTESPTVKEELEKKIKEILKKRGVPIPEQEL